MNPEILSESDKIRIANYQKKLRTNAGFTIIAERPLLDEHTTVVLAVKPNLSEYVTWICLDDTEYYHGHYTCDFDTAVKVFQLRS